MFPMGVMSQSPNVIFDWDNVRICNWHNHFGQGLTCPSSIAYRPINISYRRPWTLQCVTIPTPANHLTPTIEYNYLRNTVLRVIIIWVLGILQKSIHGSGQVILSTLIYHFFFCICHIIVSGGFNSNQIHNLFLDPAVLLLLGSTC